MQGTKPGEALFFRNLLFGFFSLVVVALSICVLLGCRIPSESKYQLYSVNASTISHILGKNCTSCNLTAIPDRYMFGLSGTCRSTNGAVRCQRDFPNTFNITAAVFADITSSNGSSTSSANVKQSEQYSNTMAINHALVHRLSEAVGAILIVSVVLNICFLPIRFFVDGSKPMSRSARILFLFVSVDFLAQCAAVGMVYLIMKKEIVGPFATGLRINRTNEIIKFEVGFWLLVGAAACRPLNAVLSELFSLQTQDQGEANHRQRGRSSRIKILNTLRDTNNVDPVFYASLTSKLISTINVLRTAVGTYPYQEIFDESCKALLTEVQDNEKLASLMSTHFNRNSAAFFLGIPSAVTGSPPGPLLWEGCPIRGCRIAPASRSRGVYLIILSECCHGGLSNNTPEYRYVGSGQSAKGGVMLRVAEHTDPGYRGARQSELYRVWDGLRSPCVAIYLLAEWDPLPVGAKPGHAETFPDILLAEAIWQVVLQPSVPGHLSHFTQFVREHVPGNIDLMSNVWRGCNVKSALEKSIWDDNTRR